MSVDILGTSCDQCRSMVQYSFTSTETRRLVRTDSPGRPPWLSHSSWIMKNGCDVKMYFCMKVGRTPPPPPPPSKEKKNFYKFILKQLTCLQVHWLCLLTLALLILQVPVCSYFSNSTCTVSDNLILDTVFVCINVSIQALVLTSY